MSRSARVQRRHDPALAGFVSPAAAGSPASPTPPVEALTYATTRWGLRRPHAGDGPEGPDSGVELQRRERTHVFVGPTASRARPATPTMRWPRGQHEAPEPDDPCPLRRQSPADRTHGAGGDRSLRFSADVSDTRKTLTGGGAATVFEYDEGHRLTTREDQIGGQGSSPPTGATAARSLTSITSPSGRVGGRSSTDSRSCDARSRRSMPGPRAMRAESRLSPDRRARVSSLRQEPARA